MLSVFSKLSILLAPSVMTFFTNFNLSNMTKLILLDSLLQEDRVLAPQGPSSISAVAELV